MDKLVKFAVPRLFKEVLFVFCGAFLLLLVIGVMSIRGIDSAKFAGQKARHASAVREGLLEALSRLKDIESDARGYALTGRRASLDNFTESARKFEAALARLQSLPHEDPLQVRRFDMLRDRADRVTRNASRWVSAPGRPVAPGESARILSDGQALIGQTRAMIGNLIEHEDAVEAASVENARRLTRLAYGAVYSSILIALVLLTIAALMIRAEIVLREDFAERIRASQRQLQAILDNTPAVVSLKDASGRFILANHGYERLISRGPQAIVGKTDFDLWPEPTARSIRANDERVLKDGAVLECEEVVPLEDGPHTYISLKFPLMGESGKLICGVSMDITERKRVEALKNEVIGMASHDLRSPLTIIQGALRFVLAEDHPFIEPESRPILEMALRNSRHMLSVIDSYLDLAALESGRALIADEAVNLKIVVEEAVESMRLFEPARGLRYALKTPSGPTVARGDALRLREVVDNLLSNAAKFSPDGAAVDVELSAREGRVRLSVRDRGPGIRAEFAGQIFKKFARDVVPAGRAKGTGLGLSISKTLIERMGGTIGFETREKEGTTFFFELPAAEGGPGAG